MQKQPGQAAIVGKVAGVVSTLAVAGLVVGAPMLTANGQGPRGAGQFRNGQAAGTAYRPEAKWEVRSGFRYLTANGIPDHVTGQFPNPGNPSRIAPQDYHFQIPLAPQPAQGESRTPVFGPQLFGVAINGVVFDPGTAELWNGNPRWRYEALSGMLAMSGSLGADQNFAHVQPNGAYHYHGLPMGLLNKLDYKHKMALVGYAADGYPIYGPYVYANANDPTSPLKMVRSGYRIKSTERPGGNDGPGGACDGSFASDFEYVKGSSGLDAYNGRIGVTPEYPKGTFYYVLTDNWPFVPRQFRGTPDSSFRKGPMGGPGGQGGPGFGGGPGGGGRPGGFGGGPGGPPRGMVPGTYLEQYLGLSSLQRTKLAALMKTIDALGQENFMVPSLAQLKLTDDQIQKIAAGHAVRDVLTAEQKRVLEANQRPGFGGQGGFGGPGGPGGPGGFGGPPPQEE